MHSATMLDARSHAMGYDAQWCYPTEWAFASSIYIYIYPYLNWDKRVREVANGRARPGKPDWPTRPTRLAPTGSTSLPNRCESPRVARRAAPSDKSRPKKPLERLREATRDDFREISDRFSSRFSSFCCTARANGRPCKNPGFSRPNPCRTRFSHFRALCKHRTKITRKSLRRRVPTDLRRKISVFSLWDATWR